jgi:hypothetical protein
LSNCVPFKAQKHAEGRPLARAVAWRKAKWFSFSKHHYLPDLEPRSVNILTPAPVPTRRSRDMSNLMEECMPVSSALQRRHVWEFLPVRKQWEEQRGNFTFTLHCAVNHDGWKVKWSQRGFVYRNFFTTVQLLSLWP